MSEVLYPKDKPVRPSFPDRAWRVEYHLIYDGGSSAWFGYYRTKTGAKIASWWNYNITSWGGSAVLFNNKENNE